jgi:hypothetical protein
MTTLPNITEQDVFNRFLAQLPNWFGTRSYQDGSILNLVLAAYVYTGFTNFNQYEYIFPNMRLRTMNDIDQITLFAQDFFGNTLQQLVGQSTDGYQDEIEANIMSLRGTRHAMYDAIVRLTGIPPLIFEPWMGAGGGLGAVITGYGGASSTNYTMGYNTAGLYGSGAYQYQAFITVFVPYGQFMANYPGYGGTSVTYPQSLIGYYSGASGSEVNDMWYGGSSLVMGITNQQIYNTINATKVFGTIVWVNIEYVPQGPQSTLYNWIDNNNNQIVDNTGSYLVFNNF